MIETFQAHSPKSWQSSQKFKKPSKGASEVRCEETLERLQPSPCLGTPPCSIRRAAGGGQVIVSHVQHHSYQSLDEHNLFTLRSPTNMEAVTQMQQTQPVQNIHVSFTGAREVEKVVYQSEGWWTDLHLLLSMCSSIDTETRAGRV